VHPRHTHSRLGLGELASPGRIRCGVASGYPSLTAADLEAAWEYAAANVKEIDAAIRENEEDEPEAAE
jgi:hypothetical protein